MKIKLTDIFDNQTYDHEVEVTTDHPCSSYGQPVVVFDDGSCLNAESWFLGLGEITKATDSERDMFGRWVEMASCFCM